MTSPLNPTVEAAYSHASALGDKSAGADEIVEALCELRAELLATEGAIDDMPPEAEAGLGPDLCKELKDLSFAVMRVRQKVELARTTAEHRAEVLDREYHDALAEARELEAVGSAGAGE